MDVRKRFFTQSGVEHWDRLTLEAVTSPSLAIFKKHLDNSLRDRV